MLVHCYFDRENGYDICVATPCLPNKYFHPRGLPERDKSWIKLVLQRHAPHHPFATLEFDESVVNCIGCRTDKKLYQLPSLTTVLLFTFHLHTPVERFSEWNYGTDFTRKHLPVYVRMQWIMLVNFKCQDSSKATPRDRSTAVEDDDSGSINPNPICPLKNFEQLVKYMVVRPM
jgi:hypothetical protein